jgi:hypothetical protein
MVQTILRILDGVTVVLAIIAVYSLSTSTHMSIINSSLLLLSPLLLLIAKFKGNRLLLFLAYVSSTIFFTSILYNGIFLNREAFFYSGLTAVPISLVAVLFSILAAYIGFGTNTLTIVWLTLHALVAFETLQGSPASTFFEHFWSPIYVESVIRDDYPILLMMIWLGLFLDKYQRALTRDYISQ